MSEAEFKQMVATCKEYILAGDAFQIVPSQRFSVPFKLPPLSLYRSLRRINPSPFLIFFDYGDFTIVGSSPEILVRLRDNIVTIRPLAGTIRRGATPEEDKQLADKLLADPKEHAEHLMLLDLARNDVGRVSKLGSVRVVEQFTIEKYSHLQHISSHVEGTLEDGLEAIDALKAGFPAGTLAGAPKVRAMEIIDEVEPVRRGIYAGCAGYFAANGSMDTCIMLRTAFVKDGVMYVQVWWPIPTSRPSSRRATSRRARWFARRKKPCVSPTRAIGRQATRGARLLPQGGNKCPIGRGSISGCCSTARTPRC